MEKRFNFAGPLLFCAVLLMILGFFYWFLGHH